MRTRDYDYFDTENFVAVYSFQVMRGGKWHNVAEDSKPLLFETAGARDIKRAEYRMMKETA